MHKNLLRINADDKIYLMCNQTSTLTDKLLNRLILFNYSNLVTSQIISFSFLSLAILKQKLNVNENNYIQLTNVFDCFK